MSLPQSGGGYVAPTGGHPQQTPGTGPQVGPPQYSPPSGNPQPTGYSPAQPVSGGGTGAHPSPSGRPSSPPGTGHLLGVDLGTSHTVAVIRWPDGRTRPLLVDGAPVMPSAVFLDEARHIHIGRDAQRLAQTDPTRYEPNPKHRIGDATVLLGDQEVPTTALLAAILRDIAQKTIEAVGHLPPTVLTCPAKWASQRREILSDAAAQAGFPPVRLVPEPVAAAHYYAEVMRHPIPTGGSVAVFDFGGGTLDVAVVRHETDGRFAVLADGGLDDLGGLDIDAALVEYMGRTISASVPQIWQQLTQPSNGTDRRARRLFWDDVRGAKEMLSRTTVAPVPVPGVESSLHMTRDELEQLAGPMLARAVEETRRVIESAHLTPDQLSGLFLVGGASRIPLVARMLHSQLGIAPSVLEQPEIPVAEGSIVAAFAQEPQTEMPPMPPTEAVTRPPEPARNVQEGFLEPKQRKPWYAKRGNWIAAAAAIVVLALLGWWLWYDPYPQNDMEALQQVGGPVPIPGGDEFSIPEQLSPWVSGDTAFFGSDGSDGLTVTAVDLTSGEQKWQSDPLAGDDWTGLTESDGLLFATDSASFTDLKLTFINPETGQVGKSVDVGASSDVELHIVDETVVAVNVYEDTMTGYDAAGAQTFSTAADFDITAAGEFDMWSYFEEPLGSGDVRADARFWTRDDEGTVAVYDAAADGEQVVKKKIGTAGDAYKGYAGKMFVADEESGNLAAFDIEEGLKSAGTVTMDGPGAAADIKVCGETRVCVLGDSDDDDEVDRLTAVDFADGVSVVWQSAKDDVVRDVGVAGETVMAVIDPDPSNEDIPLVTRLYDADGERIGGDHDNTFTRIDSGSFVQYPYGDSSSTAESTEFTGLGARDGEVYKLGTQAVIPECVANANYLACPTEAGYTTWQFRSRTGTP